MMQNLLVSNLAGKFIRSFTLLIAGWLVNFLLRHLIRLPKSLETKRAKTLSSVIHSVISATTYAFILYFIFKIFNIDITPLLASAGIAGMAIGLGARSLVEDLFSGIFLLLENSVVVGDFIRTAKSQGIVQKISFRTITLKDDDGALHIIPNGEVRKVINLSRTKARVNISFAVKTEEKIDDVLKIAQDNLAQIQKDKDLGSKISSRSEIKGIESFEKGGRVIIKAVLFTHWQYQWKIARRFRYLLKKSFEESNILLA